MLWYKWPVSQGSFLWGSFWAHVRAHTHSVFPRAYSQGPQSAPQLLNGPNMETEAQSGKELVQELGELLGPNSHPSVKSLNKW